MSSIAFNSLFHRQDMYAFSSFNRSGRSRIGRGHHLAYKDRLANASRLAAGVLLTVFSSVPCAIRITNEHMLQIVAAGQIASGAMAAVALVVVVALLALLGVAGHGQEAKNHESLELHC